MAFRARILVSAFAALLVVFVGVLSAVGQVTTGQITGSITDVSGAIVPGAKVVATNEDTGISAATTSNSAGNYTIPLLQPGQYRVEVEKSGFRSTSRLDVVLHVSQVAQLNFRLEVGAVSSTITVRGGPPLLETNQSSVNTVIDSHQILELPSVDRNTFDLVLTVPGAYEDSRPSGLYGNNIPTANISINGGLPLENEVLLDGIPDTAPQFNQYGVIPPPDSIQEFKVLTSNLPAEFGRTSGGIINVTMRSGTNQFHGVVYEFLRNSALDANQWFNNHTGQRKSPYKRNDFGFSGGGPILKNKTFFFGNYEGLRQILTYNTLMSVPTLQERQGDFSGTFAKNGQLQRIYDPFTTTLVDGVYQRSQFSNNQIPAGMFSPQSVALLKYLPMPNLPGDSITHANNYVSNAKESDSANQFTIRIDEQLGSKDRMFARFSRNKSTQIPPNIYDNIATPSSGPHAFTEQNIGFEEVHTFTSRTLGTLRAGLVRLNDHGSAFGIGFDPTTLGFPSSFLDAQPNLTMPSVTVDQYTASNLGFGTGTLGPVAGSILNNFATAYTFQGDVTHVWGKHVLMAGGDLRLFRVDGSRPYIPQFTFSPGLTQGPNANVSSATAGNSFASFLLGLPDSGSAQNDAKQDTASHYLAGFVQDDYTVTPKLTLNLGFRVAAETFRTDRHNRLTTLNFTTPSPLQITGLPTLRGGLNFVGVNGRPRQQATTPIAWEPRFGLAYQLNSRTVLRGAYGIIEAPRAVWDTGNFGQTGFSSTTSYIATNDGVTPIGTWSDPYPNGYILPTGSSEGLLTNIGGTIKSVDYHQKLVYMQQWNVAVERSLGWNTVLDVGYVGSKGTHLQQNRNLNQLPDADLALGTELTKAISNPFYGKVPAAQPLGGPTVQAGQLLRPYPQFTNFNATGVTAGSSIYHSLQVRAQKRMSNGLQFLVSYTFSKLIDDVGQVVFLNKTSYQDNNNLKLERAVSPFQPAHLLTLAATYQLPVGRGRMFLPKPPRILSAFVSGWELNAIGTFRNGLPLGLTAVNNSHSFGGGERPNRTGLPPNTHGSIQQRLNDYINTAAFSQPAPFTFGNASRTIPNLLGPGSSNLNLSVDKAFQMTDRFRLQFRAEAFNALNHPTFDAPGTALGSKTFGVISSADSMRILQFALKLYF